VVRSRSERPRRGVIPVGESMSGTVKPREMKSRDTTASLTLRDEADPQKGEDPSSILFFLCSGLSRSGDTVVGHTTALGRQSAQPRQDMPQTTSTSLVGSIGIQTTIGNSFSLSPISPERVWGAVRSREQNRRYSRSTSTGGVGFACFDWTVLLLLLLLGWYDTNNNRVELTFVPTSCTHTLTDVSCGGGAS